MLNLKPRGDMISFPVIDGVTVFMPPPEGYVVDFANPARRAEMSAYWACGVGTMTAFIFFVQYLYVKLWMLRKWDAETVCLILAWLFSVAVQASLVLFAKLSLVLFYRRLSPQIWWKCCVHGVTFFVVGYNVVIFFVIIFACHPFKRHWEIGATEGGCINETALYVATAVLGIVSDLVLLLMPIPMIVRLQMPSRQKLGLILLFSIGSATLVTSVVRLVLLLPTFGVVDQTWAITPPVLWIFVEANLLVICPSLTTLRRFFAYVAPKVIDERGSSARYNINSCGATQKPRFRAIRSAIKRKRADQFRMMVDENYDGGIDLRATAQVKPTEVDVTTHADDGQGSRTFGARHSRRIDSPMSIGMSSHENQMWDPRSGGANFESDCTIIRIQTVSVTFGEA
ncbi:Fc.00g054290.m01.CDS01 [Cosmosporella sp. VM-42]